MHRASYSFSAKGSPISRVVKGSQIPFFAYQGQIPFTTAMQNQLSRLRRVLGVEKEVQVNKNKRIQGKVWYIPHYQQQSLISSLLSSYSRPPCASYIYLSSPITLLTTHPILIHCHAPSYPHPSLPNKAHLPIHPQLT
jgi:hypothetical protein